MSDLSIVISGVIEKSNFDEWKTDLVEKIRSVNTTLKTDEDFAAASKHVKQLKATVDERASKQADSNAETADYTVTIEVNATEEEADAIRTVVVEALSSNSAIGNITLSAV